MDRTLENHLEVEVVLERVMGVDEVRPRLGAILEEVDERGEAVVITSRSKPRGVLVPYRQYLSMREAAERAKRALVREMLEAVRGRAEKAGLSEEDVAQEVRAVRRARRR